jgi:nitric oxide reductase large subunit
MPEDIINDPTDGGTKRPNAKPLLKAGRKFTPMILPDFDFEITLPDNVSPDDPITLFTMYYTPEIIDTIVQYTNQYQREPRDFSRPDARALQWYPTCPGEIYIYLAIRIYMTLYVQNEISDYWDSRTITPSHPITKYMARNRFQELHIRFRVHGSGTDGPYDKVR